MSESDSTKTSEQTDDDNTQTKNSNKELFRRVFKNSSVLLGGNLIQTLSGLVSIGILIQCLGIEEFGFFVLLQAYTALIGDVFMLESWQVMTRHGAEAISKGRLDACSKILRFGLRLDLIVYIVGTIFAATSVWWFASWQNWPSDKTWLASLYSLIILFRFTGMPVSVFNLFNRFSVISAHAAFAGILRLVVLSIIVVVNPTLEVFVISELLVAVFSQLVLTALAWMVMKQHGVPVAFDWFFFWKSPELDKVFQKQFIKSAFQSSLSGTIRIASTHLVLLGIGSTMGVIAVAHFKIIQSVGNVIIRIATALMRATYPEFVRASQRLEFDCVKKLVRSLDKVIAGLAVIATIAFLAVGSYALEKCFGSEFLPVYWPMLNFLILSFLGLSNSTFIPRLWAIECHREVIWLQAISSFVHLAVLIPLSILFGLNGVIASFLAYHILYRIAGNLFLRQRIQELLSGRNTLVTAVPEVSETDIGAYNSSKVPTKKRERLEMALPSRK